MNNVVLMKVLYKHTYSVMNKPSTRQDLIHPYISILIVVSSTIIYSTEAWKIPVPKTQSRQIDNMLVVLLKLFSDK